VTTGSAGPPRAPARPPPLALVIRARTVDAAAEPIPITPRELRLGSGRCVVGAGSGSDMIVEDKAVSRRHLELEVVPEGVAVRDLGSRNGTYYLGQRIESVVVSPGSRVRFGGVELRIEGDLGSLSLPGSEARTYRGILGASEPMRWLFALLARLEGSLVNVLVEGDAGTGKELTARALHDGSLVSEGPFVMVDCRGQGRLLSELFGHRRGSFDGAYEDRPGALEAAHGGTLFLRHVDALPTDAQPPLLRALESGTVKRVGDPTARPAKVRVIAATRLTLADRVADGAFREDLYERLAVIKLRVPTLAERPGDVALLVVGLAEQAGAGPLPEDLVADLAKRDWPGNVRQLRDALLGQSPESSGRHESMLELTVRLSVDADRPYHEQKEAFTAVFTRAYFDALLEKTGGDRVAAARISQLEQDYLKKLLAKYLPR
jgi:DNA-binding NtrC family response regulator